MSGMTILIVTFLSRLRYSIFLFLLLVTLLLGESFLRFIILGLWGIFILFHVRQLDFSRLLRYRFVVVGWLGLLGGLFVSALFSQSIPASLDNIMMWSVGFLIFVFFLIQKDFAKISLEQTKLGVLLVSIVMTVMGTAFFFLPDFASKLPGMNMFHATYGHNHLAALLLLALPIAFQRFIEKRERQSRLLSLEFVVFVFLFVGIVVSFGRTIYVLTFLELLILSWIFRKKIKQSKIFTFSQRVLLGTSGVLIIVYFGSSLLPKFIPHYSCPNILQQVKLCKNLATEGRWQYWEQGLRAFRDFPLTGYGPGTFGLLSKRYQQSPGIYTAYAHNFFIQQLAETGIIGVLPLIAMLLSIGILFIHQEKKFFTKERQVFVLAIAMSIVNALLDFDWSFSGIFFLTIIFIALLLREMEVRSPQIQRRQLLGGKIFFFSILLGVFTLSVISLSTEMLVLQKKYDEIIHLFPYFSSQRLLFLEKPLDSQETQQLLTIYSNDPNIRRRLVKVMDLPEDDRFLFLTKQFELDPWSQINPSVFTSPEINTLTLEHQQTLLEKKILFMYAKKAKNRLPLTYDEEREIVQQFLQFSDQLAQEEKFDKIGQNYVFAHKFFEWSLSDHRPFFLNYQFTTEQRKQFLSQVNFVPADFFGAYASDYANEYFSLLSDSWSESSLSKKQAFIQRILRIAPWDVYRLSELVKQSSLESWDHSQVSSERVRIMLEWGELNTLLADFAGYPIEQINGDAQDLYVRHLVRTANFAIEHQENAEMIGDFYTTALNFYPWILYEEKHWMDIVNWQEIPFEKLKVYADQVIGWQGDQITWKVKEHIQMYQQLANWEIDQENWSEAEKYLQAMQQVESDEYWSKAQLGHYFLMRGELEKAQHEYENCLATSSTGHYECSAGLEQVKQKKVSEELYYHVSQEIFAEKNW